MTLEAAMGRAEAVLLDFDGPVCWLFAGRPNHVAASRLRALLEGTGVVLPRDLDANRSPLRLLEWTGAAHPQLAPQVDDVLTEEETLAAEIAQPTPGASEAAPGSLVHAMHLLHKPAATRVFVGDVVADDMAALATVLGAA